MLNNAREKSFLMFVRKCAMETMVVALKWYKETGDERFIDEVKKLAVNSEYFKKEIEKLK